MPGILELLKYGVLLIETLFGCILRKNVLGNLEYDNSK